jgi:hypothetical protein
MTAHEVSRTHSDMHHLSGLRCPTGVVVVASRRSNANSAGRLRKGECEVSIPSGSTPRRRAVTSASHVGCARSCRHTMKLRGRSASQNRLTDIGSVAVSPAFSGVRRSNAQREVAPSRSW